MTRQAAIEYVADNPDVRRRLPRLTDAGIEQGLIESSRRRKLTRYERLELAADAGHDTWDDYRGER